MWSCLCREHRKSPASGLPAGQAQSGTSGATQAPLDRRGSRRGEGRLPRWTSSYPIRPSAGVQDGCAGVHKEKGPQHAQGVGMWGLGGSPDQRITVGDNLIERGCWVKSHRRAYGPRNNPAVRPHVYRLGQGQRLRSCVAHPCWVARTQHFLFVRGWGRCKHPWCVPARGARPARL